MKTNTKRTEIELRNGRTKVIVDPRSGSILRIEDVATGLAHIEAHREGRADGRLFRLLVPTEAWWSCYADSQNQTQVSCEHKGNRVTLHYPDLKAADGQPTGIAVRVDIRAGDMPDEFRLSMGIENHGRRTVLDTAFPLLGGWHEHGTASRFALGANSFFAPRSLASSAGNNYMRNGRRADWHYPVSLACPWVVDHEPERAAIAFAMGMQLCLMVHGAEGTIAEESAFAERVHALASLRKQTAGRTVMGRFRGQDGLTVDGDNGFAAYAYQSPSGPAVIVAACGAAAKGKVTVSPDAFAATNRATEGVVFGLDGSQIAHTGMTREFDLGKNDVAVWTL